MLQNLGIDVGRAVVDGDNLLTLSPSIFPLVQPVSPNIHLHVFVLLELALLGHFFSHFSLFSVVFLGEPLVHQLSPDCRDVFLLFLSSLLLLLLPPLALTRVKVL